MSLGTASLSNSSCLPLISRPATKLSPVTLPPGRARLATKPFPIGSGSCVITMGMVLVASLAARVSVGPAVPTIRSTLRRTNSAASSGRRSDFCSANRYSMVRFFPSVQPSLLISCWNAFTRTALPEAVPLSRKPMRKIFPACCASTEPQSAKSMAQRVRTVILLFMVFLLSPPDTVHSLLFSLDDFLRSIQQGLWNRDIYLFSGLQIDHQFKLHRLLDRYVRWFGPFENL